MSPQPLSGYLSVLLVVLGRVDPSRSAWVLIGAGSILSPIRQTSAHTSARECQVLATASVAPCAASGRWRRAAYSGSMSQWAASAFNAASSLPAPRGRGLGLWLRASGLVVPSTAA